MGGDGDAKGGRDGGDGGVSLAGVVVGLGGEFVGYELFGQQGRLAFYAAAQALLAHAGERFLRKLAAGRHDGAAGN